MNSSQHRVFKIFISLNGPITTFVRFARGFITVMLMSVFLGNIALARDLDRTVLQKEASESARAQDANTQTTPAQTQPLPTSSAPTTQPQITQPQAAQPQTQPANPAFTLPAGARLPLGLVRPLWYKSTKPGTDVYLQVTFPVTVGTQMLVPPGTYVQGVIEKVLSHDRARGVLEFEMRSANLIFSNGYTAAISGIVTVAKTSARLLPPQSTGTGQAVPAMAAVGDLTTPPLPMPSLGNGPRNAIIGLGVAAAVGTTALVLLAGHSDFEMEVGTPMAIVLPVPVTLDAGQVMAAVHQYDQQIASAPPQIVQPPKKPKICYDPGTPGTPDTVIPGSPGTPDTVIPGINGAPPTVIPGSPRTPDTVIPGTPGTPGRSYPCP